MKINHRYKSNCSFNLIIEVIEHNAPTVKTKVLWCPTITEAVGMYITYADHPWEILPNQDKINEI